MKTFAELYSDPHQIRVFGATYLEWPEIMLLHQISGSNAEMLDLGIGAGRTSVFFLPIVKRYVGVDIAEGMISKSRQRLEELGVRKNWEVCVADAADLSQIDDESFDLVLFSFNGVDCIPEHLRDDCFRTVRRVLRRGGRFVFTSHNLRFIETYYRFHWHKHPRGIIRELARLRMLKKINGSIDALSNRNQVAFRDGAYAGQLDFKHVHVKPEHQMKELERFGFTDVRAISRVDGHVFDGGEAALTRDPWIYYFCKKGDSMLA